MKIYVYLSSIFLLSLLLTGVFFVKVQAEDYTNSNFILRNPALTILGGRSTTTSFEFYSAVGQTAPGQSTNSSFTYQAGFLYFDASSSTAETTSGGPGGRADSSNKIVFSGKAYPNGTVVALKDAQIAKTITADNDGNFAVELTDLSPGDYIFSLYGKDYSGRASRLLLFPIKGVSNQDTKIRNIIIPPTITKNKKQVKKGEAIEVFGQSLKNATITIIIQTPANQFSIKTISQADGKYTYTLDTSNLHFGEHKANSSVAFENNNIESSEISFLVGDEDAVEEPSICPQKADLNNDCAVNLVDFSILIYWFNRNGVPTRVDLNSDGVADLVDFSIMAYWWTG